MYEKYLWIASISVLWHYIHIQTYTNQSPPLTHQNLHQSLFFIHNLDCFTKSILHTYYLGSIKKHSELKRFHRATPHDAPILMMESPVGPTDEEENNSLSTLLRVRPQV